MYIYIYTERESACFSKLPQVYKKHLQLQKTCTCKALATATKTMIYILERYGINVYIYIYTPNYWGTASLAAW